MALIKLGSIVADIRGSIAGVTFARNRSGAYARARIVPIQPQTSNQGDARAAMAAAQAYFRQSLTVAQQNMWREAVELTPGTNRLGESIKLTAANAFVRINTIRTRAGLDLIEEPPVPPLGTEALTQAFTGVLATGVQMSAPTPAIGAEDVLIVQVSPPLSPNRYFWAGPWPHVQFIVDEAAAVELIPAAQVQTDQVYIIRYRFMDATGRLSPYRAAPRLTIAAA